MTLERGLMGLRNFADWVTAKCTSPDAARLVLITMMDETREPVPRRRPIRVRPMKWTGARRLVPSLHAETVARPGDDGDWAGARVSLPAGGPLGAALLSDETRTGRDDERPGGPARLRGIVVRSARGVGHVALSEPSGEALRARLRGEVEAMTRCLSAAGASAADAFSVRCDRSTMTRADLDAGRLVAEVAFAPAMPVGRVRLRREPAGAGRAA